ncbi:hypothetical protein KCP76_06365 [Salmonella enterica subsp. enterica serovar Weltevreden]|nr:hypothetical protein KCP76_06365 [Salmonella enterica subsp. enterica serovar Weltevreden]
MNGCPRRYTRKKAAYRSVSLYKTRFGGFALQGGRMNDCPRRYTQKKAAYRLEFHFFAKPASAVLPLQGGRMNDCPRRYVQKAAYRSVSPLHKTRFGEVLLIRPVKGMRLRRRQRHHPAIN